MNADALSDLIRTVGDDSPPEHKALFHLWSALDDLAEDDDPAGRAARRALGAAASALTQHRSRP